MQTQFCKQIVFYHFIRVKFNTSWLFLRNVTFGYYIKVVLLKLCSKHVAYLGSFTYAVLFRNLKLIRYPWYQIWRQIIFKREEAKIDSKVKMTTWIGHEVHVMQGVVVSAMCHHYIGPYYSFFQDQIICIYLLCSNTLAVTLYWLPLQSIEQATFKSRRRRGKS